MSTCPLASPQSKDEALEGLSVETQSCLHVSASEWGPGVCSPHPTQSPLVQERLHRQWEKLVKLNEGVILPFKRLGFLCKKLQKSQEKTWATQPPREARPQAVAEGP